MPSPHIGIYSGTFDPVHAGHLAFADAACKAATLEQVIFMPEEVPRGKAGVTDIATRVGHLQAALQASKHEVYRARQPQFTIAQTLSQLQRQYPRTTLSFLMGSDIVPGLAMWPNLNQLIEHHQLIVGMRQPQDRQEIETILRQLGAMYTIVTTPHAHVSSRQIREAL